MQRHAHVVDHPADRHQQVGAPAQRDRARVLGLSLALLMRLGLLTVMSHLVQLTDPLISIFSLDFSGRDLIMIVGGFFLLFKGTLELHERIENRSAHASGSRMYASFWVIVAQIVVLDAVFSIDAVITAVGMVEHLPIERASMHLDTVFTFCDRDLVTLFADVVDGIGSDSRIGPAFLRAGCGYGGSCFPKDVAAMEHISKAAGHENLFVHAIQTINANQKKRFADKIEQKLGRPIAGATIAVWGLAFKADTDDIRESAALDVIRILLDKGADVRATLATLRDEYRAVTPADYERLATAGQLAAGVGHQRRAAGGAAGVRLDRRGDPGAL